MKGEFLTYAKDIGLSDVMIKLIKEKYTFLCNFLGVDELDDIYISETVSNQGSREIFSLFGIIANSVTRISVVRGDPAVQMISFSDINWISLEEWDTDLVNINSDSRLKLLTTHNRNTGHGFTFHSSGINCKKLLQIHKKHFIAAILDR